MPRTFIPVSHGQLEGLLEDCDPPGPPRAAAVVCHPHPSFGGTMHNNVVYRVARALRAHGISTLRFNFRGVGTSTGVHAGGVGEREDVTAALDLLAGHHPSLPLWLAGFSFGARVGLAVGAADQRVGKLLGLGLVPRAQGPLESADSALFDFAFLVGCSKPKVFVHGEHDELGDLAAVRELFDRMLPPKHLLVVADAPHLFTGKLDDLESAVHEAIVTLDQQRAPSQNMTIPVDSGGAQGGRAGQG
jgi:hypothetical protein